MGEGWFGYIGMAFLDEAIWASFFFAWVLGIYGKEVCEDIRRETALDWTQRSI